MYETSKIRDGGACLSSLQVETGGSRLGCGQVDNSLPVLWLPGGLRTISQGHGCQAGWEQSPRVMAVDRLRTISQGLDCQSWYLDFLSYVWWLQVCFGNLAGDWVRCCGPSWRARLGTSEACLISPTCFPPPALVPVDSASSEKYISRKTVEFLNHGPCKLTVHILFLETLPC